MAYRLLQFSLRAALIKGGAAEVVPMKSVYRVTTAIHQKPKRQKKAEKPSSLAAIARRYMEVRRLREQISAAEARLGAR
jgi:hypothetical protein